MTNRSMRWMGAAALAAAVGLASACSSSSSSDRRDRRERVERLERDTPGLPRGARQVEAGDGDVRWRARDYGRVFVVDEDRGRVLLTRSVREGDDIHVRPDKDDIDLNGQDVYGQNLEKNHRHAIYFQPESRGGRY